MTGEAYAQSGRLARDHGGPFAGYDRNREPFLRVMRKHRESLRDVNSALVPKDLYDGAQQSWDEAIELGEEHGYRNAQTTVLAPTGTIGFMMDCDTTGVEPDIALVKYKKLVGGGVMKIVNTTVPPALARLGYTPAQVHAIVDYLDKNDTIEGAPHLKEKDLPVFDCAFKPAKGQRAIHYMGHIRMMGATQPFISGAISKTVNVPKDATVDDILQAYTESWRLGVKSISIYRDGSKRTQPLNTSRDGKEKATAAVTEVVTKIVSQPVRKKLAEERKAITHKFDIGGHEGYITVGLYEDGAPGELFLVMAKEGSTISGFADAFAQAVSYALQYGVPLHVLVDKFSHMRFEPSGMTRNPQIRFAKSIVDYVFRWLATKFLSPRRSFEPGSTAPSPWSRSRAKPSSCRWPDITLPASADGDRAGGDVDRAEPGGRAAVHHVRRDHGAQRQLLQMLQLRQHVGVRLKRTVTRFGVSRALRSGAGKDPVRRAAGPSPPPGGHLGAARVVMGPASGCEPGAYHGTGVRLLEPVGNQDGNDCLPAGSSGRARQDQPETLRHAAPGALLACESIRTRGRLFGSAAGPNRAVELLFVAGPRHHASRTRQQDCPHYRLQSRTRPGERDGPRGGRVPGDAVCSRNRAAGRGCCRRAPSLRSARPHLHGPG